MKSKPDIGFKRFLAMFLALVMVLGVATTGLDAAFAGEGEETSETVEIELDPVEQTDAADLRTLTAEDGNVSVTAEFGSDALPDGAILQVKDYHPDILEKEEDLERYTELSTLFEQALEDRTMYGFYPVDIGFTDSEGNPIEPSNSVSVKITYVNPIVSADMEQSKFELYHMQDEEINVVNEVEFTDSEDGAGIQSIAFASDTFSPFILANIEAETVPDQTSEIVDEENNEDVSETEITVTPEVSSGEDTNENSEQPQVTPTETEPNTEEELNESETETESQPQDPVVTDKETEESIIIATPSAIQNSTAVNSTLNAGVTPFAAGSWGFYHSEDYASDQSSDTGERCYIMYSPSAYARKRMPVNIHRAIAPDGSYYWAYCLDMEKNSSSSADYDYTIEPLPGSDIYRVSQLCMALGYTGGNTGTWAFERFGLEAGTTDPGQVGYEAYQATQAAIWTTQKVVEGLYSDVDAVFDAWFDLSGHGKAVGSDALELSKRISEAALDILENGTPVCEFGEFSKNNEQATYTDYNIPITVERLYGGYTIRVSGLPSGAYMQGENGNNHITISGNTITSTTTNGTDRIYFRIPNSSSASTIKITMNFTSDMGRYPSYNSLIYANSNHDNRQDFIVTYEPPEAYQLTREYEIEPSAQSRVTITKRDANSNELLQGVEFTLYRYDKTIGTDQSDPDNWVEVATATTNSSGVATFTNLANTESSDGQYRIVETSAPYHQIFGSVSNKYVLWINVETGFYYANTSADSERTSGTVDGTSGEYDFNFTVTVRDEPKTGTISVVKRDADTNETLAGAVYRLYEWQADTAWDGSNGSYVSTNITATTGSDGRATFTGITVDKDNVGKFQIREEQPPEDYQLDSGFRCGVALTTGWYSYASSYTDSVSGFLREGGTETITLNGREEDALTITADSEGYDFVVYAYDHKDAVPVSIANITKYDSQNPDTVISGVTFELYEYNSASQQYVTTGRASVTNDNGIASFGGLAETDSNLGRYRIYETDAPGYQIYSSNRYVAQFDLTTGDYSNYTRDEESSLVTGVGDDSQDGYAFVFNFEAHDPQLGSELLVVKRDVETNEVVSGVVFSLWEWNGYSYRDTGERVTTNSSGQASFGEQNITAQNQGRYQIREESAPSNYEVDESFYVNIDISTSEFEYHSEVTGTISGTGSGSGYVNGIQRELCTIDTDSLSATVYAFDMPVAILGEVSVSKVTTTPFGETINLRGAVFGLYIQESTGNWRRLTTLEETNPNNQPGVYTAVFSELNDSDVSMTASYKVVEEEAPDGLINLGWESEPFTLVPEDSSDLTLSFTCENPIPTGGFEIQKVDSETGETLANVGFNVIAEEDITFSINGQSYLLYEAGTSVGSMVTDSSGRASISGLYYGKYRVTEYSGADGYLADAEFSVTISELRDYSPSNEYSSSEIGEASFTGLDTNSSGAGIIENEPMNPSMSVAKLADRTTDVNGNEVDFDVQTGRYTEEKVTGTYYNYQKVTFTLTATNTGNVDLYNLQMRDVFSDEIWRVVENSNPSNTNSSIRTTDITFKDSSGNELSIGDTLTTRNGESAEITNITYDDVAHEYNIYWDQLKVGDSLELTLTFTAYNYDDGNKNELPNDVYLYGQYNQSVFEESLTDVPYDDVLHHDADAINMICVSKVTVNKTDNSGSALAGVGFELTDSDTGEVMEWVIQSDGSYAAMVTLDNGDMVYASESGRSTVTEVTTNDQGTVELVNIPVGNYQLTETKTVEGNSLLAEPISFMLPYEIAGTEDTSSDDVIFIPEAEGSSQGTNYYYHITYDISNTATFKIPTTGGNNNWMFIGGIAAIFTMFSGAAFIYFHRKRIALR